MRNLLEKPENSAAKYLATIKAAPTRTLTGIAIMLISGMIGGLLLREQNAEITVLQIQRPVAAGEPIATSNLTAVQIPARQSTIEWLSTVIDSEQHFATHSLPAGALLTSSDVTSNAEASAYVAIAVSASSLPAGVAIGSDISVWQQGSALPVIKDAVVVSLNSDVEPGKVSITLRVTPDSVPAIIGAGADLQISARS